jgi:hypothetical protein
MRSRVEVLQEYQRYYAELLRLNAGNKQVEESLRRASPSYEGLEAREAPERRYRWRVELDCGCITQGLTYGKEHLPTDGSVHQLFKGGLVSASQHAFVIDAGARCFRTFGDIRIRTDTPGYLRCAGHGRERYPWRKITEWMDRGEGFVEPWPADPGEWIERGWWPSGPPGWWEKHGAKSSAELYGRVRDKEGHHYAGWTVRLSCGHLNEAWCIRDLDWRPEHGHHPNPKEAERARRALKEKGSKWPEWLRLEYEARLAEGWLEPPSVKDCHDCVWNRRMVSWKPIGRLTWKGDGAHPSRAAANRMLQDSEIRVLEAEEALARAKADAARLREESE